MKIIDKRDTRYKTLKAAKQGDTVSFPDDKERLPDFYLVASTSDDRMGTVVDITTGEFYNTPLHSIINIHQIEIHILT